MTTSQKAQHGGIIVFMAIVLSMFIALTALVVDLGRAFVVKNELQNAADAAALAGAAVLEKPTSDAPNANYTRPNWVYALNQARSAIALNQADNRVLSDGLVESGYWNVHHQPEGMQATGITPTVYDKPAVRVSIRLANDNNGGPLNLLFAPIFGQTIANISATSIALISTPAQVSSRTLFPIAMVGCLFENYWDTTTGKPKLNPATGKPYVFKIGANYRYQPCDSGEWTSFQVNDNSVATIKDLITNGNTGTLNIGEGVWIQTGVKNTIYDAIRYPQDVIVTVVTNVNSHSFQPIKAFAPFHIINSVGGKGKYIEGYFIDGYRGSLTSIGDGSGIDYGIYTLPILAQ